MSSEATTAAPVERVRFAGATLPVYGGAIFLAAALVFLVQPLAAKMLLPQFGGTPAVWAVSLVFFQAVLLAGYAFAHLSLRLLPLRIQPALQLGVLAAPLALLPIVMPGETAAGEAPALRLLAVLAVSVGVPFFAVTTASPVLQRWFAASGHGASADPYFLYAASNTGSLVGLLAYPLAVEPVLTLEQQSRVWLVGYGLFLAASALCAIRVFASVPAGVAAIRRTVAPPIAWRTRLRWVGMAAIPSSLILGTTSHLSTSIASVPLLWVIPLAVYLLSFVLAFARRAPLSLPALRWAAVASTLLVAASLLRVVPLPIAGLVLIHCGNLLALALLVHRRLALERPGVDRLTEFYLLLSLGGVLGGAFNALAAPVVFDSIAEYPLALVAALLVLPGPRSLRRDALLPALYLAALVAGLVAAAALGTTAVRVVFAVAIGSLALLAARPLRLALCLAALLLLTTFGGTSLHSERTFFGVLRVVEGERGEHVLTHGTTIHGRQHLAPGRRDDPLSYYTRQGPLGQVFAARRGELERVAVVGLGAGSIAAYGRPDDAYTFYELDPAVARIAADRRWFTFLSDSRAEVRVVIGDGRLRMAEAPLGAYDLIVLDAFSSDAVPAHLLTREAVELYLRKLAPGGVVAFHITNNHLNLEPVVAGIGRSLGLAGVAQDHQVSAAARAAGANRSRWAVLARSKQALAGLATDGRWRRLSSSPDQPVWTDQFSNVLSVVDWSN
jgi:spermidine synthase